MDYNKSNLVIPSVCIYNTENGEYSQLEISSPDGLQLEIPFSLSISSQYQNPKSFTQSAKDHSRERVLYAQIKDLNAFYLAVCQDTSNAKFVDGNRRQTNFIKSDVLCFDVDNDDKTHRKFFNDETNHLNIEKFSEKFKDYEFIISTSRNHMKEKVTSYGTRSPRHKYHVFLPLGASIEDRNAISEKLDKIDFYINGDNEVKLTDTAITAVSGLYGNQETEVFYNKGGSINGLFDQATFQSDYERHTTHHRRPINRRHIQGQTDNRHIGNNPQRDWDTKNIVEKRGVDYFYDIKARHQGDGRGYWSAFCELHDDTKASLLVFNDGGFICKGCDQKGSALRYEGLKTGKKVDEVRKIHCEELGISINGYTVLNPKVNQGDFNLALTNTEDMWIDRKTYQELEKLNQKHAVLSRDGNTVIMLWETTQHSDVKVIKYSSIADFRSRYRNRRVRYKGFNRKGEPEIKIRDIGSLWELWSERRQYDGIDFHPYEDRKKCDPDEIIWDMWDDWETATRENDWKGETNKRGLSKFMDLQTLNILSTDQQFEISRLGIDLYLDHIDNVICGNYTGQKRQDLFRYLLGWMSKLVTTHGTDRVKIAPVLQGRQGCGKGTMVNPLGQLFGKHYLHILDGGRLTNNFNIHLMDKLLVYIDEAIFAGDKKIMGKLKGLLTEDEIQLEGKFMNSFESKSYMRFIYSSNEDWVVPLEWDDRRYLCIDVADTYVNNPKAKPYFDRIWKQWKEGNGKEHLYKFLTSPKILGLADEINYEHDRPKTVATMNQLLQTDEVCAWLQQIFTDGGHKKQNQYGMMEMVEWLNTDQIDPEQDRDNVFPIDDLFNSFVAHNRATGRNWNGTKKLLSQRLGDLHKQNKIWFKSLRIDKEKARRLTGESVTTCWVFKSLDEERKLWVDEMWGGDEDSAWGSIDEFTDGGDYGVAPLPMVEQGETPDKDELTRFFKDIT